MAAIRFNAVERPGLLAECVIEAIANPKGEQDHPLEELAKAYLSRDGKAFDEVLSRSFQRVALARIGVGPQNAAPGEPESDPQPDPTDQED